MSTANIEPAPGSVVIGTEDSNPWLAAWVKAGRLSPFKPGVSSDSYELAVVDRSVAVLGASPRAALYGCFELQDIIAEHGRVPANLKLRAEPNLAHRLLHPRARGGFHGYRKSDFEFIARCGGNTAHLSHDWMGEKTFFSFVPSPEFPQACDAVQLANNRKRLRQYLQWCDDFGLRAALWICELPCQGGPWVPDARRKAWLNNFPAECLSDSGTYEGQVVCLAHPLVERAYRSMIRRLLIDFPQLSMILVFTHDSSGECCDPEKCERHRGVSRLRQYNHLLAMIAEKGRKVRPDFNVLHVGWGWHYRGDPEFLKMQAALPPGGGLANLPDGEAWSFDRKITQALLDSRRVTRENNQLMLGYDIFLWGDDTVFPATELYDFPLGIAAKLRRWRELEVDSVFDQWGTQAEYVQADAPALRHFFFHPQDTQPDRAAEVAARLARQHFGTAAAPSVLAAWQKIEAAQQIQSDHTYYWHYLRPAWSKEALKAPLTIEGLKDVKLSGGEPPKPHGDKDLAPHRDDLSRARALGSALSKAADIFSQAVVDVQQALAKLPADQRSQFEHWYTAEPDRPARLTPRQLLQKQLTAVRLQEKTQRRMSRFFKAWAIVQSLPTDQPARDNSLADLARLAEEDTKAK